MIDLTPWQVNFVRKAIHQAKMFKPARGYANKDDVELDNFEKEIDMVYRDNEIDD